MVFLFNICLKKIFLVTCSFIHLFIYQLMLDNETQRWINLEELDNGTKKWMRFTFEGLSSVLIVHKGSGNCVLWVKPATPLICLCIAHEIKKAYIFLMFERTNNRTIIFGGRWKLYEIQITVLIKIYWDTTMPVYWHTVYGWFYRVETTWFPKPKIFTV